jgi:sporulation protein YlmC with PRC-barrel domain
MSRTLFAALIAAAMATPAAAQPNLDTPPIQVSGQTSPWRVSKLVGVEVTNAQDQKIGTIDDLIMNPKGQVTSAIISVGGYLGLGDRKVEIPLEVLRFPHEPSTTGAATNMNEQRWYPDHAVLNMTKDALRSMPEFKF